MSRRLLRLVSTALMLTLSAHPLLAQTAGAPARTERPAMDPAKAKQVLINLPTGAPLRVRTRDGMEVAGKLTQLTNEGIEVQALANGTIEQRRFAFTDIAGLAAGPKKSAVARALGPVLTIISLAGTAGAITAAIKK